MIFHCGCLDLRLCLFLWAACFTLWDSFPAECPPSCSARLLHVAPSAHFTLYLCQPALSYLEYSGIHGSPFPTLPESAGCYHICFNSTTYTSTRASVSPHYSQNLRIVQGQKRAKNSILFFIVYCSKDVTINIGVCVFVCLDEDMDADKICLEKRLEGINLG